MNKVICVDVFIRRVREARLIDCADPEAAVIALVSELAQDADEIMRHGKWTYVRDEKADLFLKDKWYCSACGGYNTYGMPAFCPRCGAKMQKEGKAE